MQTRVTKQKAVLDDKNHYQITWLLEAWPNLVPLAEKPIITRELSHEYQIYEGPKAEEEFAKQQVRIDKYLKEKTVELIEKYLAEKTLIETEVRIETAATTLKDKIEELYPSK